FWFPVSVRNCISITLSKFYQVNSGIPLVRYFLRHWWKGLVFTFRLISVAKGNISAYCVVQIILTNICWIIMCVITISDLFRWILWFIASNSFLLVLKRYSPLLINGFWMFSIWNIII